MCRYAPARRPEESLTAEPAWWQRFELGRFVRAALVEKVPRDHVETEAAFRRRRTVVGLTLLVGAVLLGVSLRLEPGDDRFYVLTLLLAATWVVGTLVAGPVHLGWAHTRSATHHARPIVQPVALGLLVVGVFAAGALLVAQVPPLRDQVVDVLDHAASPRCRWSP